MENNRLIILGTNEYQNPLILRAKELGYETHVFGWPTGAIGEKTADVYYPINILEYDKLWEEVQKINPCGVASIASELAMHPMNFLLRKMGIPCNSMEAETIATNKYMMRCVMRDAGIDSPQFELVKPGFDKSKVNGFKYPLIIKPVDLSASRGVMKIEAPEKLDEAIEYALGWSKIKQAIIEEFVEGQEYSAESIAYEGKYKVLVVSQKTTSGAPYYVEIGHLQPAPLSEEMQQKVEETMYRGFAAMKLEYGALCPEFRITPEGRIIFMEVAARMGGDCLGSDLARISTGMDYMGMVINIGCGKAPSFEKICEPKIAQIKYIVTQEDLEEFERVKKEEPGILVRYSEMKPLTEEPIRKSADRVGYYITAR